MSSIMFEYNEIIYYIIIALLALSLITAYHEIATLKYNFNLNTKYDNTLQECNLKYDTLSILLNSKFAELSILQMNYNHLLTKYNEHMQLLTTLIDNVDKHTKDINTINKKYEPLMNDFSKSIVKLFEKIDAEEYRVNSKFNAEHEKFTSHSNSIKHLTDELSIKISQVTNSFDQFRNEIRREVSKR